jgi:hypothetical protein
MRAVAPARSGAHAITFEISGSWLVHPARRRAAVVADSGLATGRKCVISPGGGKALIRILRINAALDRVAAKKGRSWEKAQDPFSLGDFYDARKSRSRPLRWQDAQPEGACSSRG